MTMHKAGQLFRLPRSFPTQQRLEELSGALLNPNERLVIETPEHAFYADSANFTRQPNQAEFWTVPRTLHVTAYGNHPQSLLVEVRDALSLRERRPARRVAQHEVRRFMASLSQQPKLFSQGAVHAQFDLWGERALKHLNGLQSWDASRSHVDYAIRYISGNLGARIPRLMRFGRLPRNDDDFIGVSGWMSNLAGQRSISIYVSPSVDLVTDWLKEDFAARVVDGMREGKIALATPLWPGVAFHRRELAKVNLDASEQYEGLMDIDSHMGVNLTSPENDCYSSYDRDMLFRAARLLIGRDTFNRPATTDPEFWRLRADPFGKRGHETIITSMLEVVSRHTDASLRLYNPSRWIGIEQGLVVMMSFNDLKPLRPNEVWALRADERDEESAQSALRAAGRSLEMFGWRREASPFGVDDGGAYIRSTAEVDGRAQYAQLHARML